MRLNRVGFRLLDSTGRPRILPADGTGEVALAEAAVRGRAAAAARVSSVFGGWDGCDVAQRADTNRPALLSIDPDTLRAVCEGNPADRHFLASDPAADALRFAAHGDPTGRSWGDALRFAPSGRPMAIRPFGVHKVLRNGATAIANHINHDVGGVLVDPSHDLARVMGTQVQTNLYLSERDAQGFGAHWDDHDVIILQLRGRKYWELYEPAALSPIRPHVERAASGNVAWSGVLSPGLALYIPRGWTHAVRGFCDEASLHYTIGFSRPTGLDLLAHLWLEGNGSSQSGVWPPEDRTPEVARDEVASGEQLESVCGETVARRRGAIDLDRRCGPLEVIEAARDGFRSCSFHAPFPGGAVFVDHEELADDELGLLSGSVAVAVGQPLLPLFEYLLESAWFTLDEASAAMGQLDREGVVGAILGLAELDLVVMR